MKPKVYVTRKIPDEALAAIAAECEVRLWNEEEASVPRDVLYREISEAEGLLCMLTEQVDRELLAVAPKLKIVSNMAVGYNNIDLDAASERGIMVTNTPGVLTETTADLTFALLLAAARRIVEAANYIHAGSWKAWSPMQLTGQDVYGATLGLIGLGRIGEAVVRRARGFDMNTIYYNRTRKPEIEDALGIRYAELETLLQQSDFIVVLTPYTPQTRNLIDREQFKLMKRTAVLVNTARGGIVNEAALYEALTGGRIWAAGSDVFESEPVSLDHPLLSLPNFVALPHIGSASIRTRTQMSMLSANNLLRALRGEEPEHLLNRQSINIDNLNKK